MEIAKGALHSMQTPLEYLLHPGSSITHLPSDPRINPGAQVWQISPTKSTQFKAIG